MMMRLGAIFVVGAMMAAGSPEMQAQNPAAAPAADQSDSAAQPAAPVAPGSTGSAAATQNPAAAAQTPAPPLAQTVTVPAGTAIPLTLVSPIKSRSTKPGDSVRAMVAFPVTAGTQLAIPAGTYVEGNVTQIAAHTLQDKLPEVEIHFTRMLFANGYAVDLDANSTQARLIAPQEIKPARERARSEIASAEPPPGSLPFAGQTQPPTLPPLPHSNLGTIAGVSIGVTAAAFIGMTIWMRHHATHTDYVLFDSGWQFQMVLTRPLTLNVSQVSAAASTPPQ